MLPAFAQLLTEAFWCAVDSMGTTVLVIGVGALAFVSAHLYSIHRHGWRQGWEGLREKLRAGGIGLLVTAIAWVFVFTYCVMKLIYDKHQALKSANSEQATTIRSKNQTINAQKKTIGELEAKLKEQPRVVYREKQQAVPAQSAISNLLVEARLICTLRNPLKAPSIIGDAFFSKMDSFLEAATGNAYLRAIPDVRWQRMEEEGKVSTVLRYELPPNSDLIGQPLPSLSKYKFMRITLWPVRSEEFTECNYIEATLRVNGMDVFRHSSTLRGQPPVGDQSRWIRFPLEGIKIPQ